MKAAGPSAIVASVQPGRSGRKRNPKPSKGMSNIRNQLCRWGIRRWPALRTFLLYDRRVQRILPASSRICDGPGFRIRTRPLCTSVIGRSVYFTGIWEPEMTAMAREKVREGWHILDVGADVGYYSMLFRSKCGPRGAVAVFEPDPEAIPFLEKNIALNGFENIRVFRMALSDHRGTGMMKPAGKGQLYPDRIGDGGNATVEMAPFDELWPELGWDRLDLVKIDVEGAELSVLKGMERVLEKHHPHILMEVHPRQLKEVFQTSAGEVLHFLAERHSYRLLPVDTPVLPAAPERNVTVWGDWMGT
ncbi:MAG: FkbM family methyltransferase [Kiritimatiellae bacterium]|nr:FkbM family methyltransferase [Kiritimatiellia bacterium]